VILENLFIDHPHSVGETYLEHQQHALAFGGTMVVAGIACMLHALVPALFVTTGSRAVSRLYDRMVLNRSRLSRSAVGHPGAATAISPVVTRYRSGAEET
jgi:hypothetical protein